MEDDVIHAVDRVEASLICRRHEIAEPWPRRRLVRGFVLAEWEHQADLHRLAPRSRLRAVRAVDDVPTEGGELVAEGIGAGRSRVRYRMACFHELAHSAGVSSAAVPIAQTRSRSSPST